MSIDQVRITKGGKLIAEIWDPSKKAVVDKDVSDQLYDYLFDHCSIDEGVVFRDLCLLLKDWCVVLSTITTGSPKWLGEIIDEALNKPFKREGDGVKWLELSWVGEVSKYGREPKHLTEYVSFDGIGNPPKNDPSYKNWPKGQPVHYALDFSPAYTLTKLPIKLNPVIKITDHTSKKHTYPYPVLVEAEKTFTLVEVLRGVFWELSFHGSPVSRDQRIDGLKKQIDEIKSGKVKTIPWSEIKKRKTKK